ncbi:methyltransferase type 11 [Metarhizium acridum CQMa 102]|uniref:Methyltransferase type 11 n=1 Tax=Metarhizium acridum (strain CQMa 102) TaxID=655827 RepID=E9E908_METAQ|nr:methyltransferase type 11 [Metarhizium acridum CQMa 102]EFY87644.1 methyltransferase type 11 [Metarhizium acridum CQMa 102]
MASNADKQRGIHSSWIENAEWWDTTMGLHGNKYWQQLQKPSLERLVPVQPGCRALDLATGNGLVARWLAGKGASVIASDGSEDMIKRAAQRSSPEEAERISYRLLDVTLAEAFEDLYKSEPAVREKSTPTTALSTGKLVPANHVLAWKNGGFDIVTCNMALMDISDLEPLADALPKLLKRGGIFFATLLHPIFFTSGATRFVEVVTNEATGEYYNARGKVIREYREKAPWRGVAVNGQPAFQLYFHRPLDVLLGTFFKTGLVMDNVEELYFDETDAIRERPESSANYTQIPAIMALRFRNLQ